MAVRLLGGFKSRSKNQSGLGVRKYNQARLIYSRYGCLFAPEGAVKAAITKFFITSVGKVLSEKNLKERRLLSDRKNFLDSAIKTPLHLNLFSW